MSHTRWGALALVTTAVVVSVLRFLTGTPSLDAFLRMALQILLWIPLKGALLRFLGGARPYQSALAANSSSELIGLGFPLAALGVPWPALVASFFLSSGFEGLSLTAVGTADPKNSFSMAVYVNFFVHLLMVGIFLCWPEVLFVRLESRPLVGATIILLSFVMFILPIFIVSRPMPRREAEKL